MNKTLQNILLAAAVATLVPTPVLLAQKSEIFELDPLVVKGDLLQSSIDRMPASVSVIQPDTASSQGLSHFENLLGQLPNLNWAGGTSRPRFFQIRGIGENSQFGNEIPSSSVGFIVDGIDLTGIGGVAGLFDVARVEVLRGPQAAAFGANALAGMVVIETTDPSAGTSGKTEVSLGDHDLYSLGLAVGGPLIGDSRTLSYRVSVYQHADNGYRKNRFLKTDTTNKRDEKTARLKINWSPSPRLEVDLTALYFDFDSGYDVWSLSNNSFITTTDEPGDDNQETFATGVRATWKASDSLNLSYLASFSSSDMLYSYDWDWSNPAELEALYGPEVYWGIDLTERERQVFSHDFRLSSPMDHQNTDSRFTWTTGIYFRDFEEDQLYYGVPSEYRMETTAVYGQSRVQVQDDLSLVLAARLEDVKIDFEDGLGSTFGGESRPWGGKAAIEYSLTQQTSLYGSVDRGFKAGGVNLDDDIPSQFRVYGTELLWNYELGWRGFLFDRSMRIQMTAFYMDREAIQVDSSIQLGDGNTFALFKDNAASGHNSGIEAELDWRLNKRVHVFANLGLLETVFDDYRYIDPDDGVTEIVLDGKEQAYAPGYTYAVGGEITLDNGFFVGAILEGKDSYVFNLEQHQSLSAYQLVHLNLGFDNGIWRFTLWANNLFDERYAVRGFYFANEPPDYDAPKKWISHGAPRQLGLSVQRVF